jgi:TRAP-type C4-dicarboxylate transport system permease small subunit
VPRPIRLFIRAVDVLATFGGWVAGVLLLATTALILTEVGARTFVGRSTRLAEEYSGYFLAAMILLAAAYALRNGEHIRVSILRERLGARGKRWLDRFALLVGAVVSGLLSWALFKLFLDSLLYGVRSLHHSQTPMAIPHGTVLAGAVLLFLQFLALLLASWLSPEAGEE